MRLPKWGTKARLGATAIGLAFLTGCGGGPGDGTTNEVAVQSSQEQSDAWAKAKAEGTDKAPPNPADDSKKAKRGANYSGSQPIQ